jgi:hypothetical protein
MALNDLTWFLVTLTASLDLISARVCQTADEQSRVPAKALPAALTPALAWRPLRERTQ